MPKDIAPDAPSTRRRKAALHDAIADYWEAHLKRTRWHGLTVANVMRLRRRINIHRALAAKFKG